MPLAVRPCFFKALAGVFFCGRCRGSARRKSPSRFFSGPDCIGLNRLPPEEELGLYEEHYPGRIAEADLARWKMRAWEAPTETEAFLLACRRDIGPLPLERLDPNVFFTTWGKIIGLPPAEVEPRPASFVGSARLGRAGLVAYIY